MLPPLVEPVAALSRAERERTARHRLLPELGDLGQRRLAAARVLVMGAGGLGAPVLQYLAAAGVGTIGIVDDDVVDLSNLHRQVIHTADAVGEPKVASAARRVRALAPEVVVHEHRLRLEPDNAADVLAGYDLVVDGTDTFPTRYLVSDTCAALGVPLVWGSVLRFDAQVSVFWGRPPAGVAPVTLRDLFPQPPEPGSVPSCAQAGVLGALCGVVGSMMAIEAVKLVTGIGQVLYGRVAVVDALTMRVHDVPFAPVVGAAGAASLGAVSRGDTTAGGAASSVDPTASGAAATASDPAVTASDPAPTRATSTVAAAPATTSTPPVLPDTSALRALDRPLLLDVREDDEFARDALPGATHLTLAAIEQAGRGGPGAVRALVAEAVTDPDADLVAYCVAGLRAERAVRVLLAAGLRGHVLLPAAVDALRSGSDAVDPNAIGAAGAVPSANVAEITGTATAHDLHPTPAGGTR